MLIILVVESLEYTLKIKALLNCNSLQLTIASNGYAKVIANKAKIYYFKLAAELLFKRVNSSSTTNSLNIVYIN